MVVEMGSPRCFIPLLFFWTSQLAYLMKIQCVPNHLLTSLRNLPVPCRVLCRMARAVTNHAGNVTLCLAALAALVWTLFTIFGQAVVDRPLSDDHTETHGDKPATPGTASLKVYIPENRHDDLYQIVRGKPCNATGST